MSINYNKMKDIELLRIIKNEETTTNQKNDALTALYGRYENQIHKNWHRLCSQMDNSPTILSLQDDYYSDASYAFCRAIEKIDLSRVKDDKFKCVGMVDWYLRNVRSNIIRNTLENSKVKSTSFMSAIENEDSLGVDPDVEESYWENEGYRTSPEFYTEHSESEENCLRAVKHCLKNWTPFEREIFNLLKDGKSKAEIARILKEKPIKIYNTTSSMKKDMKIALGY